MNTKYKGMLVILDGMGLSNGANAIEIGATTKQDMPFVHQLMQKYGHANLIASGEPVGLDKGQAGNSEIGHVTIGAGTPLPSTLAKIRQAYHNNEWANSAVWGNINLDKPFHIVGMLSDAGVHAHWQTIIQAAKLAVTKGITTINIHLLLDGVDSQAGSAIRILEDFYRDFSQLPDLVKIVSIMGRKWSSDRAANWQVTQHAVNCLMGNEEQKHYKEELLLAHLGVESEQSFPCHWLSQQGTISSQDTVLFASHRADRISQLVKLFSEHCHVLAMVELKLESVSVDDVFFKTKPLTQGLVSHLADNGYQTTRLSEQCKFPHITYFINGMQEDKNSHCIEILTIADDKIKGQPEMSLPQLLAELETVLFANNDQSVIIVNIPNLDQVGHSGSLVATKKAATYVDQAVSSIVQWCEKQQWQLMITADHGNADVMIDDNGLPVGSHSENNVPLIAIDNTGQQVQWAKKTGTLANVAASFSTLLNIPPAEFMHPSLITLD